MHREVQLRAIDMHAHVPRRPGLQDMFIEDNLRRFFRLKDPPTVEGMAAKYQELDAIAVIFSVDAESVSGDPPDTNDYVTEIVEKHPDRFIGFATVDPWKGDAAVEEVERAIRKLGLKGLKLHPIHQAFDPGDDRFYPLWEKCAELKLPVVIHSGFAAAGAGMRGGAGLKLKHSRPIPAIDDIAADFPDVTLIMAHPAWPWVDEQIAVALHKPNVYIDLSGWAPRYIPKALIHEANTRLRNKIMFGSDFPYLPPDRWLEEFAGLEVRDEVRPLVLYENAKRVLGWRDRPATTAG